MSGTVTIFNAKKCHCCGKEFCVMYPKLWVYRKHVANMGYKYFCSYTCYRAVPGKRVNRSGATEIAILRSRVWEKAKKQGLTYNDVARLIGVSEKIAKAFLYDKPVIKESKLKELEEQLDKMGANS